MTLVSDENELQEPKFAAVDLNAVKRARQDEPYFTIRRAHYPDCSHTMRGFTLNRDTRKVHCKCGEECDPFDALLFYAHAEQRLVSTLEGIKEHQQKEADKKARRPFAREVRSWDTHYERGRGVGFNVTLECGHRDFWSSVGRTRFKTHPPRKMTCDECVREARLKERGVVPIAPSDLKGSSGQG